MRRCIAEASSVRRESLKNMGEKPLVAGGRRGTRGGREERDRRGVSDLTTSQYKASLCKDSVRADGPTHRRKRKAVEDRRLMSDPSYKSGSRG